MSDDENDSSKDDFMTPPGGFVAPGSDETNTTPTPPPLPGPTAPQQMPPPLPGQAPPAQTAPAQTPPAQTPPAQTPPAHADPPGWGQWTPSEAPPDAGPPQPQAPPVHPPGSPLYEPTASPSMSPGTAPDPTALQPGQPGPGWWLASDGNWYPPHQSPGWQQNPAVPPPVGGGGPVYYQYGVAPEPTNGVATASLVLGIISLLLFWSFGFGIVIGIIGFVLAVVGRSNAKKHASEPRKGQATAGLILNVLGVLGGIVFFILLIPALGDAFDEIEDQRDDGFCDPDDPFFDPDC